MMDKVVVLGIGNVLLADEGIGVLAVKVLEEFFEVPSENVELVDGGVGSFQLLPYIEKAKRLLVIDAIAKGSPPGTLHKFTKDTLPKQILEKLSIHEVSFLDILTLAEMRGFSPEELVVLGLEPESLEMRYGLSPSVKANFIPLIEAVVSQLKDWGIKLVPKKDLRRWEELFFVDRP